MNSDEKQGGLGIYVTGGAASLAMAAITLMQFVVFAVSPPPLDGRAAAWFEFFASSPIAGLAGFELGLVLYSLLSIPLAVALFLVLRRTEYSRSLLFLVLSIVASACFVMARPAIEMESLARAYGAATSDGERLALLAAGEGMVATFHGTAFYVSYFLGSVSGIVLALIMLRSTLFSRATAYLRLGSAILDFGLFIPVVGLYVSLGSVVALLLFNVLVGIRLLRLEKQPERDC
jgi:hypothetical protein